MLTGVAKTVIYQRKVSARLAAKRRRVLHRAGAYGMRTMRNNIRQGRKTSSPGQSPRGKTKTLKRNIYYDVDVNKGEATIGVALLPSRAHAKPLGGKKIPEIIDGGGKELLTLADKVTKADYEPRPILDPVAPTIEEQFRTFANESGL